MQVSVLVQYRAERPRRRPKVVDVPVEYHWALDLELTRFEWGADFDGIARDDAKSMPWQHSPAVASRRDHQRYGQCLKCRKLDVPALPNIRSVCG